MTENRIAEGLLQALQAEAEGRHFYLMAAQSTQDAQGRRVFEQLAEEEMDHYLFLKAQYKAVTTTGAPDLAIKLGQPISLAGTDPIFSPALRARAKSAHFEMTALGVGIQLELAAHNFYTRCAAEADEPNARRFFGELAQWEHGHYEALLRQQESLKNDYWDENGFAPF